jgi:hypothetical protein
MVKRLIDRLTGRSEAEEDAPADTGVTHSRDTGGVPNPDQPDQTSTTGTTPDGEHVGRVAGQDVGYAGETGAEARAEAERRQSPCPPSSSRSPG